MKYFILAIALMATGANAAELLGLNAQGHHVFNYQGVRAICSATSETEVTCLTQSDQWLLCEFREPQEGFFDRCMPIENPNLTPS